MSTENLYAHLKTGTTTVARAWAIDRKDGVTFGFTDHDLPLEFEGIQFAAEAGLTARAVHQTSGLAVDNTEAMGALTDARITEADINAGLYDDAVVRSWLVNWTLPEERKLIFKGTIGEVRRKGGAFEAELRGLTEALNTVQGRVFQKPCSAVFGDDGCTFDTSAPGYFARQPIAEVRQRQLFLFEGLNGFAENWFQRGRFVLETGEGASIEGWIKTDSIEGASRAIELWEPIRADIRAGDVAILHAGCDKKASTCRTKFNNILNFQGFPFIPGDDWLMSVPKRSGVNDGGTLS